VNIYKKLGGQTLIYGLGNIVPRMLNYAILTSYFTYRFSVEQYGIITELYAYVSVLLVILTYGMETGLFKYATGLGNVKKVFNNCLLSVICTSFVFIIIVLLLYKKVATLINYEKNPEYIALLGITVAIDAITALIFAKIRIEERVKRFAIIKILNVIINIILVFFFLELLPRIEIITKLKFYNDHLIGIEIGYVFIANLLTSLIVLFLLVKEYKYLKLKIDKKLLLSILKYSLPLLIVGLAGMINESIERILLRFFLPDNYNKLYEIGIYGANYRIALLMTIFIQMFRYAAEPFFFINYKKENAKQIYADVFKYFLIFCLIIFLFVTMYLDILKYFISKKFHSGLRIVNIVLVANMILGLLFNVNMWYKLTGKTYFGVIITGIGAFLTIILNIIFIPKYSYIACAWIHLISNSVMFIMTYLLGNKYYKIDYNFKRIGEITGFALLIYLLFEFLKSDIVYRNIIIGTILICIFLFYCQIREKLFSIFIKGNYES
jgi:O-antigen/teichoic acid export membrane protein